ncbi:hypothetical protein HX030_09840 [Myroides odoratimimus]|uniref:hypothetical protein n=1 Tax=Myroides odoratimimus TaxID=76832 RepID=UPI002574A573|nr:hypothetical protein [Myroides odoratimimus]MDM1467346.1 hypothetical protein [Myroides odoratimimus]
MKDKENIIIFSSLVKEILFETMAIDLAKKQFTLSKEFTQCIQDFHKDNKISAYFITYIDNFLTALNYDQRKELVDVILNNQDLFQISMLIMASKMDITFESFNDNIELAYSICVDYLHNTSAHPTIHEFIHNYLNNLYYIPIEKSTISLEELNKVLLKNSQNRSLEEVLLLF